MIDEVGEGHPALVLLDSIGYSLYMVPFATTNSRAPSPPERSAVLVRLSQNFITLDPRVLR